MSDFNIITDYAKKSVWSLSDKNGSLLYTKAVGTFAEIGSNIGLSLAEQTQVLDEMVENLMKLRDHTAQFSPTNFPALKIESGVILPPTSLDVSALASSKFDVFSTSVTLAEVDKLVELESWLDRTFGEQNSDAYKVTYLTPGATTDSWMVLRNVLPISTLPSGSVPVDQSGNVLINKPFSNEGQSGIFMMIRGKNNELIKASVGRIDEVFSKVKSLDEYQKYIETRALERSKAAIDMLKGDEISNFSYDSVAWRKIGDESFKYAKLPIVSILSKDLQSTVLPSGTIVRTEKDELYYIKSPKVGTVDASYERVEIGASFFIAPDEIILAGIRAKYGDQVTVATQISAKQGLYINELMQKKTLHFDVATNILKMFSDLHNKMAGQL